jgi:hypothetical protein
MNKVRGDHSRFTVFPKRAEKSTRMSNFPLVRCPEESLNPLLYENWKITAVIVGFSSFAADNVAPTKAELEEIYAA